MLTRYNKIGKKSPRKYTTRWLTEELDRIVSLLVRLRTPYCVLCASTKDLECGHYFPRFLRPVRWELDNLSTLCRFCNSRHEFFPDPYREFQLKRLGPDRLDGLDVLAHSKQKFTYSELEQMYLELKAQYEKERVA